MEIIQRGAEAILYKTEFEGQEVLVKERVRKGYRIEQLDDKIRQQRTKTEESLLTKARRAGVPVPRIWDVSDFRITMEWIGGKKLKDILDGMGEKERKDVFGAIGESVAMLHSAGIVHGDLTTSNMVLKGKDVYFIDFGLGKISNRVEDQAADLYLLYEALKSAHFRLLEEGWAGVLKAYKQKYSNCKEVFNRIEDIKRRRRYM